MKLKETKRRPLIVFTAILSFISLVPATIMCLISGYTWIEVESKAEVIMDFGMNKLPTIIVGVGLYCVLHNSVFGGILISSRRPGKRKKRVKLLMLGFVLGCILFIVLVCVMAGCLIQPIFLEDSFHEGILNAMKSYKKDVVYKTTIDQLQMEFECCGSGGYSDWFKISWIDNKYVPYFKGKSKGGDYYNDDVPYSCCNLYSSRPCINHHIYDNDMHYNYDYSKHLTIYKAGCRETMIDMYGFKLMRTLGFVSIASVVLQLIIVLLTRLLQTSIKKAIDGGDPEAETVGYIFGCKIVKKKGKSEEKEEKEKLLDKSGNAIMDTASRSSFQINAKYDRVGKYAENFRFGSYAGDFRTGTSAENSRGSKYSGDIRGGTSADYVRTSKYANRGDRYADSNCNYAVYGGKYAERDGKYAETGVIYGERHFKYAEYIRDDKSVIHRNNMDTEQSDNESIETVDSSPDSSFYDDDSNVSDEEPFMWIDLRTKYNKIKEMLRDKLSIEFW